MEHPEDIARDDDTPAQGDTSGGPLSSGAGEGSGQDAPDAPDADVPGGAMDNSGAADEPLGGG